MKKLLSILLLLLPATMAAQITISGVVYDELGEPIIGAHIYTADARYHASSNEFGYYVMTLAPAQHEIIYSYVGCRRDTIALHITSSVKRDIYLTFEMLDEVVVSDARKGLRDRMTLGAMDMPIDRLTRVPSMTGERDVIKGLSVLPGISAPFEMTTGLSIRGAAPDQNLLLLDNAPVYNNSHLFGLFSVFNSDAIKSVEVHKGYIPAQFGDRVSSVISVTMKEGNLRRWEKKFALGLLSNRFTMSGPLKDDRTAMLAAVRLTNISLLVLPFRIAAAQGVIDSYGDYFMHDLNLKVNHKINDSRKLYLSFYSGNDYQFGANHEGKGRKSIGGFTWGNVTSTVRHTKQVRPELFVVDQAVFTRYRTNLFSKELTEQESTTFTNRKRISILSEYSYSKNFSYQPSAERWYKFGLDLAYRHTVPLRSFFESNVPGISREPTREIRTDGFKGALFFQNNWQMKDDLILDMGIRLQNYLFSNSWTHSIEPRINVGYEIEPNLVYNLSYSRSSQSIHGLLGTYDFFPVQGWVNASADVPIQVADLYSMGIGYAKVGLDIRLDGYYRRLRDQLDFQQGSGLLTDLHIDYSEIVETGGVGTAYGVETYIDNTMGRLKYILSHTLSWSKLRFDHVFEGNEYFHPLDQRHNLSLFMQYSIGAWAMSSQWQYNTGRRQSLPVTSFINPDLNGQLFYSPERNNYTLPDYHVLNLSFTKHWISRKRKHKKSLVINLHNAYFRKNVSYYRFDKEVERAADGTIIKVTPDLKAVTILPTFPSFSYIVEY